MASLFDFQKQAVAELLAGKHIIVSSCGSGKSAMAMTWAEQKCKETGKHKVLVVTTASKCKACFPKGTKIATPTGEKNIEDIRGGDIVLSYNGDAIVERKVYDTLVKKNSKNLYSIDFRGSCNIIGTEDHPFYVGNGEYKEMGSLKKGDIIYGFGNQDKRSEAKTRQRYGKILQIEPKPSVFCMRETNPKPNESPKRPMVEKRNPNLLRVLPEHSKSERQEELLSEKDGGAIPKRRAMYDVREKNILFPNEEKPTEQILPSRCSLLFKRMFKRSNGHSTRKGEVTTDTRTDDQDGGIRLENSSSQWHEHNLFAKRVEKTNGWGAGICRRYWRHLCENRFGIPREKNRNRNRRACAPTENKKTPRQRTRQKVEPIRVEDIQVFKRCNNSRDTVYCISVEDTHNFFANGILVHNCNSDGDDDFTADARIFCSPSFSESLSSSLSLISWHKLSAWVDAHYQDMGEYVVILDEVQKSAAGVSSQMGKAFLKLTKRNSDWAGFTGTPGDTWLKFYAYFTACGLVRNKTSFLSEYANIQTYKGFPEIIGWRNEGKLKQMWAQISYAPDTSKVMAELPKETYKTVKFSTPSAYTKVLKTRFRAGSDGTDMDDFLDTPGALTSELRRVCFTKDKQEWVKDFVENLESGCVMFYNYIATGDKLEEIIKKALPEGGKVWRIDGSHHDIPTAETIGKKDVVLCQWQSGSEALNLQFLHYMVLVELCYSYSTFTQGLGRIKRVGQKHPMGFYLLICDKGIEQDVLGIIRTKGEFSTRNWCLGKGIKLKGE